MFPCLSSTQLFNSYEPGQHLLISVTHFYKHSTALRYCYGRPFYIIAATVSRTFAKLLPLSATKPIMETTMTQLNKSVIILTGPEIWDDWYGNVRRLARGAHI